MTSLSQNKWIHVNYNTPPNRDPPEGKTMAVIAVMRGKPKDGYHCHHSNTHCRQKLVRVLVDSGYDSDPVFVNKDKPCCFLTQKGWFHSCGILQMGSSKQRVKLGWS